MNYQEHVAIIAAHATKALEDLGLDPEWESADYSPFESDIVREVIDGEASAYAKKLGWYGNVKNRYDMDCEGLTIAASQMIAGASPNIELSFNNQYRKDMFRDVAWGALLTDVVTEIKKEHPELDDPEFWNRAR